MKICWSANRERGLTLVELFVVIAVIALLAMMLDIGPPRHAKARALRIQCVNNLKQTGLAFRVWAGDQTARFPMQLSATNGGTMEFTTGLNAYKHFQIMSNELSTPKVLICPADPDRWVTITNFNFMNNSNISFFVGVDATETNVTMILSGDRNITNGMPFKNGLLEVTADHPATWNEEMHNKVGNVLLADGSVQQLSLTGVRHAEANTGVATNRLQMPVITP